MENDVARKHAAVVGFQLDADDDLVSLDWLVAIDRSV
jgi:hypothetical protein